MDSRQIVVNPFLAPIAKPVTCPPITIKISIEDTLRPYVLDGPAHDKR